MKMRNKLSLLITVDKKKNKIFIINFIGQIENKIKKKKTKTKTMNDETTNEILQKILTAIDKKTQFAIGSTLVNQIGFSILLVFSLALNDAFKQTFGLITIKGDPLLGSWIYVLIITPVCFLVLWLLYTYLQPIISSWLDPK